MHGHRLRPKADSTVRHRTGANRGRGAGDPGGSSGAADRDDRGGPGGVETGSGGIGPPATLAIDPEPMECQ